MSLPLSISLVRNYQWERSRPPTTVVPDLIGLPLMTGRERAHSVHLMTPNPRKEPLPVPTQSSSRSLACQADNRTCEEFA